MCLYMYIIFSQGIDEDKGPQSRKLYGEVIQILYVADLSCCMLLYFCLGIDRQGPFN